MRKTGPGKTGLGKTGPGKTGPGKTGATPAPDEDRQFVVALARGLSILEALARAGRPLANGDIAAATGLAPSTVSRLVHTLRALGYLRGADGGRRYAPTAKNLALGYPVLSGLAPMHRAAPMLHALAQRLGETVALAIRDGLHVTFIEVSRGSGPSAVPLERGGRLPLAQSSPGIALIAALPEAERRTVAARARGFLTRRGITVAEFDRALAQALAEGGLAVARDAWQPGVGGVSVPVRLGAAGAALTVPVATFAVSETRMRTVIAPALRDLAQRLQTPDEAAAG